MILILFLIVGGFAYYQKNVKEKTSENEVCFGRDCFNVEIVSDDVSRSRGLMFREELGENSGMLFVFESEGVYPFWMKDTLIPLDMIWINSDKEIVFIKENAVPLDLTLINPGVMALYVLEINGGRANEIELNIGDKAELDIS